MPLSAHWRNRARRRKAIAEGRLACIESESSAEMQIVATYGDAREMTTFNTAEAVIAHFGRNSLEYYEAQQLFDDDDDEEFEA